MSALTWLGIAVLGGLGAVLRFALDGAISARARTTFPVGTLAVNLAGSLVLGLLVGAGAGTDALRVAGIGLLGSFTTFSTWMLESERLAEEGQARLAGANLAVSLALGIFLAWAGMELGERL